MASDGTVLARSVRGREGTYHRTYPTGSLFAQAVGYSFTDLGQSGIERYRNAALDGEGSATNLQAILDQLQGKRRQGDEVITTLEPAAQRAAISALGEHRGAVVALDPRTGAVQVMASTPSYDPNLLSSSSAYERLTRDSRDAPGQPRDPVRVRARIDVQGGDGHSCDRHRPVHARIAGQWQGRHPGLGRAAIQRRTRVFGQLTLTEALVKSVNTVYAQVAEHLGKRTLARYMSRFGFDRKPQLDYPSDQMSVSGEYSVNACSPPRAGTSTSDGWGSARTNSRSCRCRWPRSRRRSPTGDG